MENNLQKLLDFQTAGQSIIQLFEGNSNFVHVRIRNRVVKSIRHHLVSPSRGCATNGLSLFLFISVVILVLTLKEDHIVNLVVSILSDLWDHEFRFFFIYQGLLWRRGVKLADFDGLILGFNGNISIKPAWLLWWGWIELCYS